MSSSENYSIQSIDGWETGLEAILNSAVDAIIIIDSDGKIQLVNPAAEKLFQYFMIFCQYVEVIEWRGNDFLTKTF